MTTETQKKTNGKATTTTALAQAPASAPPAVAEKDTTIRGLIERSAPKFAQVLPRHLSVDRLVRVTVACIARTPALGACTQTSLLNAVMQAAQLGLEPTGVLGGAYLVPYGKECQLIVGYRGLIDLARRSGTIESIEAHVVHENDRFVCHYGLEPVLEHEPCWKGDPGEMIAVYGIAKLKDGGRQLEVMTRAQVDAIRAKSKAGRTGPWVEHYDEMARKTVVRRLCKYLPLTPELVDALQTDVEPLDVEVTRAPAEAPKAAVERLRELAAAKTEQPAPEPPHDPATGEVREPGADDGEEPPEDEDGEELLGADGRPL